MAKTDKQQNKSGKVRANDTYTKLKAKVAELEEQKAELNRQKSTHPERIDVTGLQDYKHFKTHDNEGKNLFDFTGSLVWNVRKKAVEILKKLYPFENDVVDLFYAIIDCHGTVQINATQIIVTLQPLQQSSRRIAQIDFCRKLTQMGAKTPMKKNMIIKVSEQL